MKISHGHNLGAAVCTCDSGKAIKVLVEDLGYEVWIPQSQVHEDSEVYALGDEGDIIVSEWFARERGWS